MMNKISFSIIALFALNWIEAPKLHALPLFKKQSDPIILSKEQSQITFYEILEKALYFSAGGFFESVSIFAQLGEKICLIHPSTSLQSNECLLLSKMCKKLAKLFFMQAFRKNSTSSMERIPPSYYSWYLNQMLLSQIPVSSEEDKKLLLFLEKRWLAKSTGFFSFIINWICPCFEIFIQIHPETTNSYARDPWNKLSQTYLNRVKDWKQFLPHPKHYPLILTRPFDCHEYLPSYVRARQNEAIQTTLEKSLLKSKDTKIVVDLTSILSSNFDDRQKWMHKWQSYQKELLQACKELCLNPKQVICIQTIYREEIGGIRLLAFTNSDSDDIEHKNEFLLEWVSKFGLSANRIELDRGTLSSLPASHSFFSLRTPFLSKEEFTSYLQSFNRKWKTKQPQKTLMFQGTLQILKGLFAVISQEKWDKIVANPTKFAITKLSFFKIKEQLELLNTENDEASFYDTVFHLEQIQASITPLLEIFSPFTPDDFQNIYQALLPSIPPKLKTLTSYGIHSSGMTSFAGILKAAEKTFGETPHILYGENTYFEAVAATSAIATACFIENAIEKDWEKTDLILAQFNPALRRLGFKITDYKLEKIEETLRKSLHARQGKPVILALDCTLDFIDSPRIGKLLDEFQEEITSGILAVICYHSGLKFDLFGMDNYCGSPFYMIHSQDTKWDSFDSLLTDPVLQTDALSFNWFCLAYQNAGPQLELYRKHVFDNTRDLLNKIPLSLFNSENTDYRIIPVDPEADLSFIDIKIFGLFHKVRGCLIAGLFTVNCMEKKHPLFYRCSLGFYHPNLNLLFSKDYTTIRLTLGLDPSQIDLLADCFTIIDDLKK